MFLLQTALLLSPPALADVAPEDTSEEEEEEDDEDKGCSTVALSASLIAVGIAAIAVGWRRED